MSPQDPPSPWIDGLTHVWGCNFSLPLQEWTLNTVAGGKQIFNAKANKCLTSVPTDGGAVGLDKGIKVVAGQLKPCLADGAPTQTFTLENDDKQGFPDGFPVRLLEGAANPYGQELCLQPQIQRTPRFDAVAFQTPDGSTALVAINIGDVPVDFTLVDKGAQAGLAKLTIPPHAIHTYTWQPDAERLVGLARPTSALASTRPASAFSATRAPSAFASARPTTALSSDEQSAPLPAAAVPWWPVAAEGPAPLPAAAAPWWPFAAAGCVLVLVGAAVVALLMRKQCKEGGEAADEYVTWEPYKGKEGGFIRRQAGAVYAAISS